LIVRLPLHLPPAEEAQHWERLGKWLTKQLERKPGLLTRYQHADYQSGDTLRVGQRNYQLLIEEDDRRTHGGRLEGQTLRLTLARGSSAADRSQAIRTLLSRVIGRDFLPEITARVHELNDRFFRQPIKSVRLKYNHSNWGSCSHTGNINLSTRLLFAPPPVIDYVIIHELAHLLELNHSDRYWALVGKAMPDYEQHEKWLSEHGHQCDF
ncbi:MAG: M48 family metallopeptidase, partial [Lewinella sp.]|nr:M48 family metallopeptidase [Lewinella sp.]